MSKTIYNQFTNKFGVSKTLRFELIPQGSTLANMEANGILSEDEHRAESYLRVKKMIDEYHKFFIDDVLWDLQLEGLERFLALYEIPQKSDKEKEEFQLIQEDLRKQIVMRFKNSVAFKTLFSKELITVDLPAFFKKEEERALLEEFAKFTTYFTGFHENRKNIYSAEEKSTAVAYRLIHENLPRFIQNMKVFEKVRASSIQEMFPTLTSELQEHLQEYTLEEFFVLDSFNRVLTQEGITTYNLILNGYSKGDGEKVKGLNEYINLYNQKTERSSQLPKLQPLYKQILSDYESASFIPEQFKNDEEVIQAIYEFHKRLKPMFDLSAPKNKNMRDLLTGIGMYDLDKIYVHKNSITELSHRLFGDWSYINRAFYNWYDKNYEGIRKPGTKGYEKEREQFFKNQDSFSIAFVNMCCQSLEETKNFHLEHVYEKACDLEEMPFYSVIEERFYDVDICLKDSNNKTKKGLSKNKVAIARIKAFLDYIKEVQGLLKPLLGKGNETDRDEAFYSEFLPLYEALNEINLLYDRVRNYLTKKPYSTEKIKLNFGNAALLSGWSVSKESNSASVILRKNGLYYLGIMDKSFHKIFEGVLPCDGEVYEKMEYKLLPGANKMLPKVFFSAIGLTKYQPSEEILRIYKEGTFKKGNGFSIEDCHKLIDFFKESIAMHEEWSKFGFKFSDTKTYEDISGFYREVEAQGYQLTFKNVSCAYIEQLVKEGKLYLFQIYNKDFSPYSKGTPNLHTLYFKALFSPENLKDVVYKLNGQAEVFYRKASIAKEHIITHPANEPVANKNPLNPKKESVYPYTLYKDRRYTMDKFQFHVPITMNFKATGLGRLNQEVNALIKQDKELYVIGINRGERHLFYISVVDPYGKIVEQYSLNEIVNEYQGVTHRVDYNALLSARANERDSARKNWDTIQNIKELKEGYISQVIHKITQLMMKYHAIVVMEDLNFGFVRGRQAIEKQVYQKFTQMLIDKLNYYVDKKLGAEEYGGLYHAYQLTNKFESFQKLGKQSGFVFFAPAWNISNIDPTTGFVNLLYCKYENMNAAKSFFGKFDDIYYDSKEDYFCFVLDYSKFSDKVEDTKTKWTVCSFGDRVRVTRDQKNGRLEYKKVCPVDMLKSLFHRYGIVYDGDEKGCLQEQILKQSEKGFYVELYEILGLILQMRNHDTGADYLISPVMNQKGTFFDSRKRIPGLPDNIEANGSYNIARKGLWMLEQIRNADESQLGREKLAMSNAEWLKFAQDC